ncbi:unnamed protein product [Linum trigynum]|uniref:Uncharacterized protein n=1 Tax=Linum trigynum TaxID=586398 RepID=A0AAV2D5T6_9ROSI
MNSIGGSYSSPLKRNLENQKKDLQPTVRRGIFLTAWPKRTPPIGKTLFFLSEKPNSSSVILHPPSMAAVTAPPSSAAYFRGSKPTEQFLSISSTKLRSPHQSCSNRRSLSIVAMAPQKKVNKIDGGWKKQWYGAGIFYESGEELEVDVFKKLEKRKVLSNVEKAGLLSKAEELGVTLSSIEKLGLFSKAEELGLLSLLEKVATVSPAALASAALPAAVAALAAVVIIPDDSAGLVAVQAVVAGTLGVGAAGLFVGSILLEGLQEAD